MIDLKLDSHFNQRTKYFMPVNKFGHSYISYRIFYFNKYQLEC